MTTVPWGATAIFTRTRKREVANATPRRAFTFPVTLSPAERAFYDGFLAQVRRDLRQANGGALALGSRTALPADP